METGGRLPDYYTLIEPTANYTINALEWKLFLTWPSHTFIIRRYTTQSRDTNHCKSHTTGCCFTHRCFQSQSLRNETAKNTWLLSYAYLLPSILLYRSKLSSFKTHLSALQFKEVQKLRWMIFNLRSLVWLYFDWCGWWCNKAGKVATLLKV